MNLGTVSYTVWIAKRLLLSMLYFTQLFLCPPAYIFWYIMLQPLRILKPPLFWKLESFVYDSYLGIIGTCIDLNEHTVYETGADIDTIKEDKVLLIANHQSLSDIFLLMRCLHSRKVMHQSIWIMDWVLQFLNFGWVSKCHGDFFLLQPVDAKRLSYVKSFDIEKSNTQQFINLEANLKENMLVRGHKWVILFPEGGLLYKRRSASQRYAEKQKLRRLNHITYPRTGAMECVVNTLTSSEQFKFGIHSKDSHPLKWILDVTIAYKTPMQSFLQYFLGFSGKQEATLLFRIFPINSACGSAGDSNALQKVSSEWLYKRYQEKEELLEYFKEHGSFPTSFTRAPCKPVNHLQVYGIQVFVGLTMYGLYCLTLLVL